MSKNIDTEKMTTLPIFQENQYDKVIGKLDIQEHFVSLLAEGLVVIDISSRGATGSTDIMNVTLCTDPWRRQFAGDDRVIRKFFRELRTLMNVSEGENVAPAVLNTLRLLNLAKAMNTGDPLKQDLKDVRIHPSIVLALLGGEWPTSEESGGFSFSEVDHYRIEEGRLVPFDEGDDEAPGPDFELKMIPFL